jgi:MoxR-like ATPase
MEMIEKKSGGPLGPDEIRSVEAFASSLDGLRTEIHRRIVGQDEVITQILAAVLAEGHCLIVGLPGLAKTLLVSSLSELLSLEFKRIQFTPDLMPSDITGASIISDDGTGHRGFRFLKGPIFANVILADEINRTPPKTQSALMEAMEERQVSGAGQHFRLERPFFVLATQNPIELEGTYPLPVSQLDRFLFSITIDYPSFPEELRMLVLTTSSYETRLPKLFSREEVVAMIDIARRIAIEPRLIDYAARIVRSTRPSAAGAPALTREAVAWGGGPRATQAILAASRAMALLAGRHHVLPEDIHAVAVPTLRHRIILRYHAEAEGMRTDDVIRRTLAGMPDGLHPPLADAESGAKPRSGKRTFLSRLLRPLR